MELTILKICFEVFPEARWDVSDSFKDLCYVRGYPQRAAKKILKLAARQAIFSRQIVVADTKAVDCLLKNRARLRDVIWGVLESIGCFILNHNGIPLFMAMDVFEREVHRRRQISRPTRTRNR